MSNLWNKKMETHLIDKRMNKPRFKRKENLARLLITYLEEREVDQSKENHIDKRMNSLRR
jgi:hypothetical protein